MEQIAQEAMTRGDALLELSSTEDRFYSTMGFVHADPDSDEMSMRARPAEVLAAIQKKTDL